MFTWFPGAVTPSGSILRLSSGCRKIRQIYRRVEAHSWFDHKCARRLKIELVFCKVPFIAQPSTDTSGTRERGMSVSVKVPEDGVSLAHAKHSSAAGRV